MRSPSFRARPYWKAAAVAENFRRACAGEVEESMFFWRAVNAEVWLRVYIDGTTRALDKDSYEGGFVRRGDRATAKKVANGEALLDGARLNWGRHLFLEDRGRIWARFPLRSTLIKPGDDLLEAIAGSLERLRDDGIDVEDGDVLLVSEKALAISQGRSYPIDDIAVSRTARVLSRYVSHEPTGIGLAHPTTMQLAIDEAGARTDPARGRRRRRDQAARDARRLLPRCRPRGQRDRRTVVAQPPAVRHVGDQVAAWIRRARRCASPRTCAGGPAVASGSRSSTPTTWRPRSSRRSASRPRRFWPWLRITRSGSRTSRRRSDWSRRVVPGRCRHACAGAGAGRSVTTGDRDGELRWVEIDVAALTRNAEVIATLVRPASVMVMVKSNGYGHGITIAARAALEGGATWLGVYTPEEALALRAAGFDARDPRGGLEPAGDAR